jgi:hypothetical protein
VILTTVVLVMAATSIISHQLGLGRPVSVALFPLVIITMTIERMSIMWDERGPAAAFKQFLGSLFIASAVYLIIINREAGHLLFVFPELNLVLMAVMLLLGRYTGYRLTELTRFQSLRH